jgi:hypothetical protein
LRDHEQPAGARQRRNDVFHHAVGEILLLDIATQVGERQHRERRLVGQRQRRPRFGREPHAEHPHLAGDVLQLPLAKVFEIERKLARRVLAHAVGEADAARLGQRLQPRRDVHAVAEQVAVGLHHHVGRMQADAQLQSVAARRQRLLHGNGALDCLHAAREFREQAVAHRLEHAPAVRGQERLDHLRAHRPQARERAGLVGADQPRVADHIGREDRGEAAGGGHSGNPACSSAALLRFA